MNRALVLTAWAGDGAEPPADAYHPRLADDHALATCRDVTGQDAAVLVPDPNLVVVEVLVTEEVLAELEADVNCEVLSSENA